MHSGTAGPFNVLDGHHAGEIKLVINHQHFFNTMLMQKLANRFRVRAFLNRDQTVFLGHDLGNGPIQIGDKPDVTTGNNTHQIAARQHGNTGDIMSGGEFQKIPDGGTGINGNRVFDHTAFVFLDLANFSGLLPGRHILVNNPDSAFLGHGNGQRGFGNSIHRGRNQRNIQLDTAGQLRFQGDIFGEDFGVAGQEEDIVEGECILCNSQHCLLPRVYEKKIRTSIPYISTSAKPLIQAEYQKTDNLLPGLIHAPLY